MYAHANDILWSVYFIYISVGPTPIAGDGAMLDSFPYAKAGEIVGEESKANTSGLIEPHESWLL